MILSSRLLPRFTEIVPRVTWLYILFPVSGRNDLTPHTQRRCTRSTTAHLSRTSLHLHTRYCLRANAIRRLLSSHRDSHAWPLRPHYLPQTSSYVWLTPRRRGGRQRLHVKVAYGGGHSRLENARTYCRICVSPCANASRDRPVS